MSTNPPTALSASPRQRLAPSWSWWLLAILASMIALYGLAYVVIGPRMYPPNLLESFLARPWGIYPHALFGSISLITGALQFNTGLRTARPALHRFIGKLYIISCLLVGTAGLYMSFYSNGIVAQTGFGLLAVLLLFTTVRAYLLIRERRIAQHREWMILSYALIFGAVTLRIELPVLIAVLGGRVGYAAVAWLSWVPNLLVMMVYVRRTRGVVR